MLTHLKSQNGGSVHIFHQMWHKYVYFWGSMEEDNNEVEAKKTSVVEEIVRKHEVETKKTSLNT